MSLWNDIWTIVNLLANILSWVGGIHIWLWKVLKPSRLCLHQRTWACSYLNFRIKIHIRYAFRRRKCIRKWFARIHRYLAMTTKEKMLKKLCLWHSFIISKYFSTSRTLTISNLQGRITIWFVKSQYRSKDSTIYPLLSVNENMNAGCTKYWKIGTHFQQLVIWNKLGHFLVKSKWIMNQKAT